MPVGKKTPPFCEYRSWTTAKAFAFFRSGLRAKWLKWPPRFEALKLAKRSVTGKRHRFEYECSECKEGFKATEVQVDHVTPCGSFNSFEEAGEFMRRMFVGVDKLRVLCKECHRRITNEARKKKE